MVLALRPILLLGCLERHQLDCLEGHHSGLHHPLGWVLHLGHQNEGNSLNSFKLYGEANITWKMPCLKRFIFFFTVMSQFLMHVVIRVCRLPFGLKVFSQNSHCTYVPGELNISSCMESMWVCGFCLYQKFSVQFLDGIEMDIIWIPLILGWILGHLVPWMNSTFEGFLDE